MPCLSYIYFMDCEDEIRMKPFLDATDFLKDSLININIEGVRIAVESGQIQTNREFSFRVVNSIIPGRLEYYVSDCYLYFDRNRFIFYLKDSNNSDMEKILSIAKYLSNKGFQVFVHEG